MLATEQLAPDGFSSLLRRGPACQAKALDKRDASLISLSKDSTTLDLPISEVKPSVSLTDLANLCHEIETQLKCPPEGRKCEFSQVRMWHIGSPQDVGVTSLPFIYKTLSLYVRADLPRVDDELLKAAGFETDLICRARRFQEYAKFPGGYTHPQGCLGFREEIADWFEARDGFKCSPDSIYLTNGASEALPTLLQYLIRSGDDAVLLPCPTFFLWEQAVKGYGGHVQFYKLSEQDGYDLDIDHLLKAYAQAQAKGFTVRSMVLINPGNPVPMVLSEESIIKIVRFCEQRQILLIADEVYQMTTYTSPFVSCRKVALTLGANVVVASFHSASKGIYGEGGHRAGLFQMEGADEQSLRQLRTIRDLAINPNNVGQAVMALSLNPPTRGDESYAEFIKASEQRLREFGHKALMAHDFFNSLEGVTCQEVQGGMYVYPLLRFPTKYIQEARERGCDADKLYVEELLRTTGICVIPGSSLGKTANQADGFYHLRVTIIASPDEMQGGFELWRRCHENIFDRYRYRYL